MNSSGRKDTTATNYYEQLPTMSSTTNRLLMPITDLEKIPVKDMVPPPTSKQNISFLQLPRELRDPIYRDSIAAGNVAILRLNKLVNEEASQLLPKHATLRIHLGDVNCTNWSELRSASVIPVVVQHVDLRIKVSSAPLSSYITVIFGLLEKRVIRESCIVTLNYSIEGGPRYNIRGPLYSHLARLVGFKKVIFKIVFTRYEPAGIEAVTLENGSHEIVHYNTDLLGYHEGAYMELQSHMLDSMGPAKVDESVEGHCLEFHPLEPLPVDERYPWNPWFIYD